MKKRFILTAVFMALLMCVLVGCGEDADYQEEHHEKKQKKNNTSLEGTWEAAEYGVAWMGDVFKFEDDKFYYCYYEIVESEYKIENVNDKDMIHYWNENEDEYMQFRFDGEHLEILDGSYDDWILFTKADDGALERYAEEVYGLVIDEATGTISKPKMLKRFDPFEKVSIEYTGIDGEGVAELVVEDDYELSYSISESEELSNGDEITVYVECDDWDAFADEYGLQPNMTEKDFTVEGLNEYLLRESDVTDEVIEKLRDYSCDATLSKISLWNNVMIRQIWWNLGTEFEFELKNNMDMDMDGKVIADTDEFAIKHVFVCNSKENVKTFNQNVICVVYEIPYVVECTKVRNKSFEKYVDEVIAEDTVYVSAQFSNVKNHAGELSFTNASDFAILGRDEVSCSKLEDELKANFDLFDAFSGEESSEKRKEKQTDIVEEIPEELQNVFEAYEEYKNKTYTDQDEYPVAVGLAYIDEDDIPEAILLQYANVFYDVVHYDGKKANCVTGGSDVNFKPYKNYIIVTEGGTGDISDDASEDVVYKIEKGKIKRTKESASYKGCVRLDDIELFDTFEEAYSNL